MKLYGNLDLSPLLGDRAYPGTFHACADLRADLILGRAWLKDHRVQHEHHTDCLYLGTTDRRRIFLGYIPATNNSPTNPIEFELDASIPPEVVSRIKDILKTYESVFHQGGKLKQTLAVQHEIKILNPQPFREPPRRFSDVKKQFINEKTIEMLADEVIEPATEKFSSALVVTEKPGGELRLCVDYRRINVQTVDAPQCLPRIHEILKDLGKNTIFSTLDLKSGYWQVPLTPESRKYTAFSTPDGGQYRFRVMPFGLKNAPGTFQNLMREVFSSYWGKFCIAYLDDIIIFSSTWEDHLLQLSLVLERLQIYGLTCSPSKCKFGQNKFPYLGHTVTSEGNQAKPCHVEAIQVAQPPRNRKQLSSFLGTCNWLMEYVPNYSLLTCRLTDLLSPKKPYKWTAVHQEAFEAIKRAFKNPAPLSRPDPNLPFILQTDASSLGIGAVLYQEDDSGKRHIISYASAKFSPTESRYHCNEQECLAIIWAIKKYHPYLEDRPFIVRTDSKTLTWLDQMKDSKAKLTRWHIFLSEFNFKIEHVPGKENELPDALSRQPDPQESSPGEPDLERMAVPSKQRTTASFPSPALNAIYAPSLVEEIANEQQSDLSLTRQMEQWLELQQVGAMNAAEEDFLHNNTLDEKGFWKLCPQNQKWTLRVPASMKQRVIWEYHDATLAGHPGAEETIRSIREHFFWSGMNREIKRYVAQCELCICTKPLHGQPTVGLRPRSPKTAWETLAVDLMGPYPLTRKGHRYILVVTDLFTRWVEAFPLRNAEAPTITRVLEDEVFSRYGYPDRILSDNGPQFRSQVWVTACEKWNSTLWTTPTYHPRANPTERRNQEVKKGLRLRLHEGNQQIWDVQLPNLLFTLRRRKNAATGSTPGYLLFGREIKRPGELNIHPALEQGLEQVPVERREEQARRNQQQYQRRYAGPISEPLFQIGDQVFATNHRLSNAAEHYNANLAAARTGPYTVIEVISPEVFCIQKEDGKHKVHQSQLVRAPLARPERNLGHPDGVQQQVILPTDDPLPLEPILETEDDLSNHLTPSGPDDHRSENVAQTNQQPTNTPVAVSTVERHAVEQASQSSTQQLDEGVPEGVRILEQHAAEQAPATTTAAEQATVDQDSGIEPTSNVTQQRYPSRHRTDALYRDARWYAPRIKKNIHQ